MRGASREIENWSCIIMDLDAPPPFLRMKHAPIVRVLRQYMSFILVTAQLESIREQMQEALRSQDIWHDGLYMCPLKDKNAREDILKFEMLAEIRAVGFSPQLVICSPSRAAIWKAAGLVCLYFDGEQHVK